MDLPIFQLDAFVSGPPTGGRFTGNPAAVVLLPADQPWPPDELCQAVAEENNLSETAFLHPVLPPVAGDRPRVDGAFHLRWWTPSVEVDLCGHATLAAAGLLFDDVHPAATTLGFWTRSGWLLARRAGDDAVTLDLPAPPLHPAPDDPAVGAALGVTGGRLLRGSEDLFLVVDDAATVRDLTPDHAALARLDTRGVVVTAPGDAERDGEGVDVVSRFFGAGAGIGEDPVTGSAHSQFARYWSERLGRTSFLARQLSARGGTVAVVLDGDRALLTGSYRRYLQGVLSLPG